MHRCPITDFPYEYMILCQELMMVWAQVWLMDAFERESFFFNGLEASPKNFRNFLKCVTSVSFLVSRVSFYGCKLLLLKRLKYCRIKKIFYFFFWEGVGEDYFQSLSSCVLIFYLIPTATRSNAHLILVMFLSNFRKNIFFIFSFPFSLFKF